MDDEIRGKKMKDAFMYQLALDTLRGQMSKTKNWNTEGLDPSSDTIVKDFTEKNPKFTQVLEKVESDLNYTLSGNQIANAILLNMKEE